MDHRYLHAGLLPNSIGTRPIFRTIIGRAAGHNRALPVCWYIVAYNQGMQLPIQPQELDINFLVPNVFADGQLYSIPNDDNPNGPATISFFQMRPPDGGKLHADVVASISFPNVAALKLFAADLERNITEHEKREK